MPDSNYPAGTTEALEREYNARLSIPEHPQIFARWADQAAATRRLRPCLLDLAYGEASAERLDLFPARDDGAPLLVFIHGGYWRSLDKSDFSWIAPPFVQRGINVALVNYGLAPATHLEEIVRQTLRSIAWLYRNGDRLGLDPERIHLVGHSAGAHLAAMAISALWPVFSPGLPARVARGALAISGIYDLTPLCRTPFVNVDLRLDPSRAHRLSPAFLPPPAEGIGWWTAVGERESGEFRRQTTLIGERWRSNLVRQVPARGLHHLDIVDELANPEHPLFAAAIEMVRRRT